ncbi:MAG: sulfide/dihydroorotate dehydrogenase-like FAD/NAD-binding protein [Arcanobacterium sp.]|nr:sulfide/dihydroorotate dehydrogenase-like FAD/NAD-binding protein [Arcanobacterium sp.]MDY5273588.1 sulfide/dihydroorotate dehydrogenase-like FAD/NAD-binding protein [Arcanobacterium sp.]
MSAPEAAAAAWPQKMTTAVAADGTARTADSELLWTVLKRRLDANPEQFRGFFMAEGLGQLRAEFDGGTLSSELIHTLWNLLLRDDAVGQLMMRFIWDLPLAKKRVFIRALDHLTDRYPMFAGLGEHWPMGNGLPPYVRPADVRKNDFDLVTQGYLGYLDQGYSQREVDLFVWLEALRDKYCADRPCQLGELRGQQKWGGCPVQIRIPDMMEALAEGKFMEALRIVESSNPLPNVTGRVCPQELQCQGVCVHTQHPMEIGQLEWFLPQREKVTDPEGMFARYAGRPDPWEEAKKPPIAVVGSGPSGLINAFLLANDGFPVTVFEAFHTLGGVLKYGIPEFRLPNELVDDVVKKIELLGGKFVKNFVVGKTATLDDLKAAGFWKVFVGTGAGLPRFMNVPGEHLNGVMSANEFLTRINLMGAAQPDYETPLPAVRDKEVLIIGGGNTAMDAARSARRLGGNVTIVYRRTQAEMPARVEELRHAVEEGITVAPLRSPSEFHGDENGFVTGATVDVMELGEPDASGRRRPLKTGEHVHMDADLVIMALGNSSNPIIRDSQPDLAVQEWGPIKVGADALGGAAVPSADVAPTSALASAGSGAGAESANGAIHSQATNLPSIYSGGDAARGGSTAIKAAGDGQAAARQMRQEAGRLTPEEVARRVGSALAYTRKAEATYRIVSKRFLTPSITEMEVYAPMVAQAAQAGQFVRVLAWEKGELIPLTIADFDRAAGTITLVTQAMGTSTHKINEMQVGDAFVGVAGPLGMPSVVKKFDPQTQTVVFTAGGVGLPPVYPIVREHLRLGNHVTLISGFRTKDLQFWIGDPSERVDKLMAEFSGLLDVVLTSDDGSFGIKGFVTTPLEDMLTNGRADGRKIVEVTTIGPPMMMKAVSQLTKVYGVPTVASLNSIMVDATGMCGACMVPVMENGKLVRKHACIDGPEIDAHAIDWDKFLPRFRQFKGQEAASCKRNGVHIGR